MVGSRRTLAAVIDQALQQLSSRRTSLVPAVAAAAQVAEALGLRGESRWLQLELRSYLDGTTGKGKMLGELLGVDERSDLPARIGRCRLVEGTLYIQDSRTTHSVPFPYLLTQSVGELEALLDRPAGQIQFFFPWEKLPDVFQQMFKQIGAVADKIPVHFAATQLAAALDGIRGEVSAFLLHARLQCEIEDDEAATQSVGGRIQGRTVNIVQASGNAVVNLGEGAPSRTKEKAIAQLREEVAAIQDLLIGSRKQLIELDDIQAEVKRQLSLIVDRMDSKLPAGPVDEAALQRVATQVIAEMATLKELDQTTMSKLANHGVSHSLIAAIIFEPLKALAASFLTG